MRDLCWPGIAMRTVYAVTATLALFGWMVLGWQYAVGVVIGVLFSCQQAPVHDAAEERPEPVRDPLARCIRNCVPLNGVGRRRHPVLADPHHTNPTTRTDEREGRLPETGTTPGSSANRYRTIVADPPWPYPGGVSAGGTPGKPVKEYALPYASMSLGEILALPVRDMALGGLGPEPASLDRIEQRCKVQRLLAAGGACLPRERQGAD